MGDTSMTQPLQRTIVVVDVEHSTARNNVQKAELRAHMYEVLEEAMLASGIGPEHREPPQDRGDGAMVLIRPADAVPKTLLLSGFMPHLSAALARHNAELPGHRFRLRAAIHAGDVHHDRHGVFGEDVDLAFRLLDAPELKERLRQSAAPLLLVVSDAIHRAVVRHGYHGIDTASFVPDVTVSVGPRSHRGWVSAVQPAWPFHRVTGDARVDRALHLAGQDLDARAEVKFLDPATVVERVLRAEQDGVPGAG